MNRVLMALFTCGLARVRRISKSPFGVAALAYALLFAAAVYWLPLQPAIVLPQVERQSFLIGFSADGQRIAVGPKILHLSTFEADGSVPLPDEPFQVFDVSDPGRPQKVDLHPAIDNQILLHYAMAPATRRLVWQYIDDPDWKPTLGHRTFAHWLWTSVSPDGRFAYLFNSDNVTKIWDWQSGELLFSIPDTSFEIGFDGDSLIGVSPGTGRLMTGTDRSIIRWDARTGHQHRKLDLENPDDALASMHIHDFVYSTKFEWLAEFALDSDWRTQYAAVWNLKTGARQALVSGAVAGEFVDDDRRLVTAHPNDQVGLLPRIRLHNLQTGVATDLLSSRAFQQQEFEVPFLCVSQDKRIIAVSDNEPERQHWLDDYPAVSRFFARLGISLDRSPSQVILFDAANGRELTQLPTGADASQGTQFFNEREPTMAFSPDGRRLAVLTGESIQIWDLPPPRSWRLILSVPLFPATILGLIVHWRSRSARSRH